MALGEMKSFLQVVPSFPMRATLALIAILCLQSLIEFQLIAPLSEEISQLSLAIKTQQGKPAVVMAPVSPPQARLAVVVERLQQQPPIGIRIERLHQIAEQSGVLIRKASYQNQLQPGEIMQNDIQADLSGSYPAIRQFLRILSATDDALAIETLEFRRAPSGNGVHAQLHLVLFSHQ